jgi:hypothetical protein
LTTYIYHIKHITLLPSIISLGGIACDRICRQSGLAGLEISYSALKDKRMRTAVEISPGGTLGDYVPFYFAPCSPMLLAYKDGYVTGRPENQDDIIYLVTDAEYITWRGLTFVFTDGHPITEPKAFFNQLSDLSKVDFSIMPGRYWFDTNSDPDRKRRRQAEFLILGNFAWTDVRAIGVRTDAAKQRVEDIMRDTSYKPPCVIRPAWYYPG